MNLNDTDHFHSLDSENLLKSIEAVPDLLVNCWEQAGSLPLPECGQIHNVLVAASGSEATSALMLAAYLAPSCRAPIQVCQAGELPGWVSGPHSLVLILHHAGNQDGIARKALADLKSRSSPALVITTDEDIRRQAAAQGMAAWKLEHSGPPRTAVGGFFAAALRAICRFGLNDDLEAEFQDALQTVRAQQESLLVDVPDVHNPGKRTAGQIVSRWVVVLGPGILAPVALHWKQSINLTAKAWAQTEPLPDALHSTLAGILQPEEMLSKLMTLFLRASANQPENRLRSKLVRKIFMLQGIGTDFVRASGSTALAQMLSMLHFGDYVGYYLAMIYNVDPMPVEAIETLIWELQQLESATP